ncbi:MAG: hypothetical protein WCD70_15075 [Alphaproteobacteria bacterium]
MKMTHKAYISDKTWRTAQYQADAFATHFGDYWSTIPMYEGESGLAAILRPTRRNEQITLAVVSLGVLARTYPEWGDLLPDIRRKKISILSLESGVYPPTCSAKLITQHWKEARASGAAKIGGRISADKKKAFTKEAADKIADRWPLPSKEWRTEDLLNEAGISLNTAKAHLGKRPIAQYNYQAAQKRKERRNARP